MDDKTACLLPREVFLDLVGSTSLGSSFIFNEGFLLAVWPFLTINVTCTKQRKLLSLSCNCDFCGVQSLAEAKGLGRSMDCSFHENRPFWNCGKFLYSYPETIFQNVTV